MSNRFPGTGERIRQRLRILGYWNEHRDSPDVMRFCKERGYLPQYVYEWLKGTMPAYENLKRLSQDLEVPMAWILFGSDNGLTAPRRPAPVALPPSGTRRGRGWRRNAKGLLGVLVLSTIISVPGSAIGSAPGHATPDLFPQVNPPSALSAHRRRPAWFRRLTSALRRIAA